MKNIVEQRLQSAIKIDGMREMKKLVEKKIKVKGLLTTEDLQELDKIIQMYEQVNAAESICYTQS